MRELEGISYAAEIADLDVCRVCREGDVSRLCEPRIDVIPTGTTTSVEVRTRTRDASSKGEGRGWIAGGETKTEKDVLFLEFFEHFSVRGSERGLERSVVA